MAISRMQQPRQMYQDGSIMPRLNELGTEVSSAEQMLQEINQRLQSAESTLGEGGAMQQPSLQQPMSTLQNAMFIKNGFGKQPENFYQPLQKALPENPMSAPRYASFGDMMANRIQSDVPTSFTNLEGVRSNPDGTPYTPPDNNQILSLMTNQTPGGPIQSPIASAMRNMAASGGMMGRQNYGLGSLVKSIGKTVKKVVKSPIGKAALIGAAAFGIPGTQFGGLLGRASFGKPAMSIFGKQGGIGALFANPSIAAMKTQGAEKGFLGGLIGKVPGGGYTVGAIGSILAASGMSPEEIELTKRDPEKVKIYLRDYYSKTNPDASAEEVEEFVTTNTSEYAVGGRVGLKGGSKKTALGDYEEEDLSYLKDLSPEVQKAFLRRLYIDSMTKQAEGGRIGLEAGANKDFQEYLKGREEFNKKQNAEQLYKEYLENKRRQKVAVEKTMAANGGLMPTGIMKTNKLGIKERDYRETGGFVPVGIKEKADDVPAMLSKNEFVMTADAVRGMGDGNIEKGAQRLYDQMKTMEKRVV